jgi:hypothetical protein
MRQSKACELYDRIIKRLTEFRETIPLKQVQTQFSAFRTQSTLISHRN